MSPGGEQFLSAGVGKSNLPSTTNPSNLRQAHEAVYVPARPHAARSVLPDSNRVKVMVTMQHLPESYMRGLWRHLQTERDWTMQPSPVAVDDYGRPVQIDDDLARLAVPSTLGWADAIVWCVGSTAMADFMKKVDRPVVNMWQSAPAIEAGLPTVCTDNHAAVRMAVEYFRSIGMAWYGYLPWPNACDNWARQEGFVQATEALGLARKSMIVDCPLYSRDTTQAGIIEQGQVLRDLPKPMGLICFADWLGGLVLHAIRVANIDVPNEVAVIGIDDSDVICDTAHPTLTSVDIAQTRVGYEAARLAQRLERGEEPPRHPILIPPVGVIERMSTQVLATNDPHVEAALRYIRKTEVARDHVRLSAEQVADAVGVSRRGLDAKFVKQLGHTVNAELDSRQVRFALTLLARTDLPVSEVAMRAGYKTLSHLSRVVKGHTGRSPTAYRSWVKV